MIRRLCAALFLASALPLIGCGSASGGVLVSYAPFLPSGVDPVYSSAQAQAALTVSFSANAGSQTALVNSPYDAIALSRTATTGEAILTFTITANPGYSVTLDKFNFDVGAPSVASPDLPAMLVTSSPATGGFGGPFGLTNLPGSVSQVDIVFAPLTLNPGESITVDAKFGIRESPTFFPENFQIPVGESLMFNYVNFYGSFAAAVPEPTGFALLACGLILFAAAQKLRFANSR